MLGFNYCTWKLGFSYATIVGKCKQNSAIQWLGHRQDRHRAEFDQAEWLSLPVPPSVSSIPADLMDTALEYAGILQDGWLTESAFFGIGQSSERPVLQVRGMVPLVDDPGHTTELQIVVDGVTASRQTIGLGDFEVVVSSVPGAGRRRVELHFSKTQQLPAPDLRVASGLLRFVGYVATPEASP